MFYAHDERLRLLFFRAESPDLEDAHWSFYSEMFERHATMGGEPPYAILFESTVGSSMPTAKWRQRFADIGKVTRLDAVFVLITESPLARAVVKGVNWIRPFKFRYAVVASRAAALDVVCAHRGEAGVREALEGLMVRLERVSGQS